MVRRVKAYLNNMRVVTDEEKLHSLSLECEPGGSAAPTSAPIRKRHPSPTLSTTSSASSASEGKKGLAGVPAGTKFGAASPQAMRKMLALSEPGKTRPRQPRHGSVASGHPTALSPTPSPSAHRRGTAPAAVTPAAARTLHERSHSDTPTLPVDLSAESSSVTSLSNLPLRKTLTSGQCHPRRCRLPTNLHPHHQY